MGRTGSWYPLSHGQEALWFLWKLVPTSWAYNTVLPVEVCGELEVAALRRCLQRLSDRHPCLRTEFSDDRGQPCQRSVDGHRIHLEEVDASHWSAELLRDAVHQRARAPFDLAASAALRVTLLRRGRDRHVLVLVAHHIVSDLWSFIVLMDELRQIYPAEKAGRARQLSPLPLAYEDFVRAQRRSLAGASGERLWRFWKKALSGKLSVLDLPTDHSRPPMQTFRGGTVMRRMDAGLTRQLHRLAEQTGCTLYMVLLAAYQVLLGRHTGQDDPVVGSPTSGRHRADLADLVGDFVNMLPLRGDLAAEPTFLQLLERTRDKVLAALDHQDYPFSLLVDRLQPTRDLSRSPIFQTSFVLQKFHRFEELSRVLLPARDEPPIPFADLVLKPIALPQQDGQFDLNLEMKEDDAGRLVGAWKYAADLFEADTVRRLAGHFETLLRGIVAEPEVPVAGLSLLTGEESLEVIARGRGGAVELPAATSVCELFEAQIARRGPELAATCGDASLTYSELGARVDELARNLVGHGVGSEVLVAVLLPRDLDFIAALLAISKAGGAFLPLDPRHPTSRTRQILASSRASWLLSADDLAEDAGRALAGCPGAQRPRMVRLEDLKRQRADAKLPAVPAAGLAYVMYTSGSTGHPKGVMVEHRGMVNHVLAKLSDLGMGPHDTLAQNGPQSFDIVVWQCLAPLVVGGRVAVVPDEIAEDPAALIAEVDQRGVTVLQLVPSMLHAVVEELTTREDARPTLPTLRWMVPTGEALPTELCRRWLDLYPAIPVLNTYGSTECSDDQCHTEVRRLEPADEAVAVVSVGSPIHNLSAHVLDGNLAVVPAGVVGELYVGGIGVGRGYRHDPARTAATFLADPLSRRPGGRLYRTRDLARRRPGGQLDFLGRLDHMIKLRGFRIEPGEVEAVLCRHPAISEAAVVARAHPAGERRLVGYLVPTREGLASLSNSDSLRRYLVDNLPSYMVPATLCFLNALPLTANRKLDARRLPAPAWQAEPAAQLVAPRTPTEKKLADIWAEVLRREASGVTEDFFAIGGDSIRSVQIAARCKRAGLRIRPSDLFVHPTIETLAALADRNAPPAPESDAAAAPLPDLQVSAEHLELALAQVEFDDE